MRALAFEGPAPDISTSRVIEVAVPEPGLGTVTVDVHYAGINFKDVMARRGDPGYVTSWPFVPGLEVAGTIRAVGPGVTDLTVGDRVAAFTDTGGLAEVAEVRAELAVRVPAALDLQRAAAAPGALATAELLISDIGRLRPGETVLVHSAAGGVGQAVARLALRAGAGLVLGTVGSEKRVAAAERSGYQTALVRGSDLTSSVGQLTRGRGVDLVLDPQGTDWLELDLKIVAPGGRIVIFGNAPGTPISRMPFASRLMAANASIGGFSISSLAATAPTLVAAALVRVLDYLAVNTLDVELTAIDGLAAAPEAQQALAEGRGRGKQVVRVGDR